MAQNGCAGCCSFSCRLTPTPTPEFDPEGRRVYTTSGRFLFIVETALGQSFLNAGSEGVLVASSGGFSLSPIFHNSNRPSLQLLGGTAFGNGSPAICDGSPNVPPGGVPGFNPPWIDCSPLTMTPAELALCESRQPAVRNALQDLACRFSYVVSPPNACTRNPFGDFAFLSTSSTRQYCFQVPLEAQFAPGERVVAVQARDIAGNLGPVKEIVIRVDSEP